MNRSARYSHLMLAVFVCLVWLNPATVAHAITVTATATGGLSSVESGFADPADKPMRGASAAHSDAPQNAVERDLIFDLASDANFSSLVRGSRPLKAASLILTVAPERFQISSDALGLQPLAEGNQHKSLNFSIEVKVDLLELYESDELLDMLTSNAGKIQIPSPDTGVISEAKIDIRTEQWKPSFLQFLLILTSALAAILIGFSVVWRKKRRTARLKAGGAETDARMALVGNMTGSIVHDVKNAFTAIRSCAEVIGDDELNADDRKDFAQLIVNEIDRGVDMTQELLDFTSGKHRELNVRSIGISSLLDEMLPVVRRDLQAHQISLQTDFRATRALLFDADKMKRVFLNIVSNARDAMPDGGTLTIATYPEDNRVCVDFSDTGCGIPPELQARMFEPMVTHGKAHGTGLGMAIVKDILDAHQAHITVNSQVDRGTTIRIMLG